MPLYEYQCDGKCGRLFEVIRKFSDPPLEKCPTCGGPIHKLQSSPAFQFKGSGFYITDYGKKDHGPSEKNEKGDKGEKSEKSEKDSKETKPSTEKSDKPAEKKASTDTTTSTSSSTTPKDKKDKS